ncbi:MAG TPA: hypothetical protein VEC76_04280 [Streptosporangiaceae bacterium]|nr:hypothetical protein [Streptosporangiaceae bacterium]
MATWLWIVIVIVIVAIALAAVMAARRRRTMALRERFGPEYDRTVEAHENQRTAEAELRDRERYRARLDIKPLSEAARARYADEWRVIQQSFVDQPEEATTAAYDLVNHVMAERGYPMRDFDAQADLVSVDHPDVVENYRIAHGIHERAERQQASTEELREAMLRYRSLFEELLRADGGAAGEAAVPASTGAAGSRQAPPDATADGIGNGHAPTSPARPAAGVPEPRPGHNGGETGNDAR